MTAFTALRSRFVLPRLPLAGCVSLAMGGLVLFGWIIDNPVPKSVLPSFIAMMPNAAVAFVLVGVSSLSAAIRPQTRRIQLIAVGSATVTTMIGLITGLEYLLG